jgi:hypothetical protein
MNNFQQLIPRIIEEFREFEHKYNHKLDHILEKIDHITERLNHMSGELDALTAQVQANNDLLDSAITLINDIADLITAAGIDPAKLAALTAALKDKDTALAAAVLANTPVVIEGAPWVATDIYAKGDTVMGSDNQTYSSVGNNNRGNDPTVSGSTFWTLVPVVVVPPPPAV